MTLVRNTSKGIDDAGVAKFLKRKVDVVVPYAEKAYYDARPTIAIDPYATPARDIYLCSSATPPGGGVHGMCGYNAARSVIARSLS